MSDETRPAEETLPVWAIDNAEDAYANGATLSATEMGLLFATARRASAVSRSALDRLAVVERECAELREERDRLNQRIAGQASTISTLFQVAAEAGRVMETLRVCGPGIVGHLLDTDDNAGERLRQLLREVSLWALRDGTSWRERAEAAEQQLADAQAQLAEANRRVKSASDKIDRCTAHIRTAMQLADDEPDAGLEALVVSWMRYHGDQCRYKARAGQAEATIALLRAAMESVADHAEWVAADLKRRKVFPTGDVSQPLRRALAAAGPSAPETPREVGVFDVIEVNAAAQRAVLERIAAPASSDEPVVRPVIGPQGEPTPESRTCESGCGCRYGTTDPDQRDCACDGPCALADPAEWGCDPARGGCGGDCPTCPSSVEPARREEKH